MNNLSLLNDTSSSNWFLNQTPQFDASFTNSESTTQSNILNMLSLLNNQSNQISTDKTLYDLLLLNNKLKLNQQHNYHQAEPNQTMHNIQQLKLMQQQHQIINLDINNNNTDNYSNSFQSLNINQSQQDLLRKILEKNNLKEQQKLLMLKQQQIKQANFIQQQQQQQQLFNEPVNKDYILSQLKAQQKQKQELSLIDKQKAILVNKNNQHPTQLVKNQIEISNDGNVKNIPPNLMLDQFGMIGLTMMLKHNDSDKNVSILVGKGDEAHSLTQSLRNSLRSESVLIDSENEPLTDHLKRLEKPSEAYNFMAIKDNLPDSDLVLQNSNEDLLFYLFYMCCKSELQVKAASILSSRNWFFDKELNLWLKQADSNSDLANRFYFMFEIGSWSLKKVSLSDLVKNHKFN